MTLDAKHLATLGKGTADEDARFGATKAIVEALDTRLTAAETALAPDLSAILSRLTALEAAGANTAEVLGDILDLMEAIDARMDALEGGTPEEPVEPAIEFRAPRDFAATDLRENGNPTGPLTLTDPALIEYHADGTATLRAEKRPTQPGYQGRTYYSGSLVTRSSLHFAKGLFGAVVQLTGRTVGAVFAYGDSGKEIDFEATYLLGEAGWSPNLWLPKTGGGRYSAGSTARRVLRRAPVTDSPQKLMARLLDDRCEFYHQTLAADLTPAGPMVLFETITPADFPADVIWDTTTRDLAIFTALEEHTGWAGWSAADYAQPATMRVYGITPGALTAQPVADVLPDTPVTVDATARTIDGIAWAFTASGGARAGATADGIIGLARATDGSGSNSAKATFPVEPGVPHRLRFSIRGPQVSVHGAGMGWAGHGSGNYTREWTPTGTSETVSLTTASPILHLIGAVKVERIGAEPPDEPEEPDEPDEPEKPEPAGMQVGMNNCTVNYYAREWPWLNILKGSSQWIGQSDAGWSSVPMSTIRQHLDPQGWPLRMPPGATHLDMLLPWEQLMNEPPGTVSPLAGTYRLRYDGQGTVAINGQVVPDNGTVTLSMGAGGGPVLALRATTEGNHVRNISLVKSDKAGLFDAGQTLDPDYLAVMDPFAVVRHLGWGDANFSTQREWADRPRVDDYTYSRRGVPLEEIVRFHNAVKAGLWLPIPHLATDEYLTQTAQYLRDTLDPSLPVIPEDSNETWNEAGPWQDVNGQTRWLKDRAQAELGNWLRWNQVAGAEAAHTLEIFASVFGGSHAARLVPLISGHPANDQFFTEAMEAPLMVKAGGKKPHEYAKALGINGYFGHSLGYEDAPTILEWIGSHGQAEALTRSFALLSGKMAGYRASIRTQVARARKYALRPFVYEGGSHVDGRQQYQSNDTLTGFLAALHRDPRMGALYTQMLTICAEEGVELFAAFASIQRHDKFGPWGTRTTRSVTTPRWEALVGWRPPA